ncbi:glycosyltransferase family A protein [uncultured Actinomyces sp.]|uniref:glycosyltransferase family 2 protein n=1 Tax=uncultured Actinomyces sp. TaxID=249061 RepID=UPI0028D76108|nr:glycosyltransferase family A protein [uncultured Actinomyces sp.]
MGDVLPSFTVICPTWNRSSALRSTIDSVLAQEFEDFELIIASDGSTDDTDAVASEYARFDRRVHVHRSEHYGFQAGPTNEVLATTESRWVAYIDHDDKWSPHHLSTLRMLLLQGADFAAVRATKISLNGALLSRAHPVSLLWHPVVQVLNPLFENSCVAHRRDVLQYSGGWRESEIGLEDWDLWLRMADAGVRVATTLTSTAFIVERPDSRQHTLRQCHVHRLAVFDDPRAARSAVRRLTDQRRYAEAMDACLADLAACYRRLTDIHELVYPEGWAYSDGVPDVVIRTHLKEAGHRWIPPLVIPSNEGWTVGLPIAVMTTEHARRYERTFQKEMIRQQKFFSEVLGGQPPYDESNGVVS